MRPLRTQRLILRNWRESDRELFHLINSDDRVMEFFPMRRSRADSDQMMDQLADGSQGPASAWRRSKSPGRERRPVSRG
jgi:RimJ/RimL family protein N-acetyltransferase